MDYTHLTVSTEPGSITKIEGELPFSELQKHRTKALTTLGKGVKLDGFRPGHIPEKVLLQHVGDMPLLTEMAERALAEHYPEMLKAHKIDAIGRPEISITKIAFDNPLGFSIKAPVMPSVTLPEYKTIAKDIQKDSEEVTDAEVEESIENVLRQKQAYEKLQKKASEADASDEKANEEQEEPLPELTDEYVKTLGDFASVDDFKKKLREHLEKQRKEEVHAKHRAAITDAIIEKSEIELPKLLVEIELNQMFGQMEEDLKRANLTMENYLEHIKKTREDLVKEWSPAAEKRAKLQIVLNEIAKKEKVEADPAKLEAEVEHLLSHYKDADESRVRTYVASMLKNEAVMHMLEKESVE